jgi:hypothetical protein
MAMAKKEEVPPAGAGGGTLDPTAEGVDTLADSLECVPRALEGGEMAAVFGGATPYREQFLAVHRVLARLKAIQHEESSHG